MCVAKNGASDDAVGCWLGRAGYLLDEIDKSISHAAQASRPVTVSASELLIPD